jgi:hypothetical protein
MKLDSLVLPQQLADRSVSDSGVWYIGSPLFDVRSISWLFADPILSHSGGLGINAECRVSFWSDLGLAISARKRLECSAQDRHLGLWGSRDSKAAMLETSISMKYIPSVH